MRSQFALLLLACALCASAVVAQQFPFQSGPMLPPQPVDSARHGSVNVGVQRDRGIGTSVHINGQADLWRSPNGNTRVTGEGHYNRVIQGPARGMKDYGAFIGLNHRF